VDGATNSKVQAVHFPRLQISSAVFMPTGEQVIACGRSRDWASFDLHSGRVEMLRGVIGRDEPGFEQVIPAPDGSLLALISTSGALLLVSAKTKQLVSTLQAARTSGKWGCQTAAFSPNGELLFASSDGGRVQVWDVRRRCCVHSWREVGGLRCTALATSADGKLVAAGADSGAVNLYTTETVLQSANPASFKEFLNLRTAITELEFNPQSELLCFASKYVKSSMRVAHVGGRHVFANWPTGKTPLDYVQCCAFSPHSGFVGVGNDKGRVLLYRLNHYLQA